MRDMMQNANLEYRVEYFPLSGRLYAGYVRKGSGKWEGQSHEVTAQAIYAVGRKVIREGNDMLFTLPDGRRMRLSACIINENDVEKTDAQN